MASGNSRFIVSQSRSFRVFASPGEVSEFGGAHQHTFFPRRGKVADEGDLDVDFDQAMETIKREFPDATDEELELIYDLSANDKDINDFIDTDDLLGFGADEDNVAVKLFDVTSPEDVGEVSHRMQNLRGKIAADQGFEL